MTVEAWVNSFWAVTNLFSAAMAFLAAWEWRQSAIYAHLIGHEHESRVHNYRAATFAAFAALAQGGVATKPILDDLLAPFFR